MKSARGSASAGRFDRNTQAVYSVRGVPLNTFGSKLEAVKNNEELESLVEILGCGIGPTFNINKLEYDKIIIMADSDSDGFNITSMLCAFFIYHMPELVKGGYIYKAVSPLYELKNKQRFVLNKQGYAEVFEKEIHDNVKVYAMDKTLLSNKKLQKLLMDGSEYGKELLRSSKRTSIDPHIIEYYLIHKDDKNFMKAFKKEFPELKIEDGILSGVYDGRYQILFLDKPFFKRMKKLTNFIHGDYEDQMYYYVSERVGKTYTEPVKMTIGEFIRMANKFAPVIKTRFKGLGELDPEELRETSMDPRNRILIQLTSENITRELDVFDILHGKNAEGRKNMMKHFEINRDDLDN